MRLAVFGGAFDPFHCGHLAVIRELLARGLCDRVMVVPAGRSPLKPPAEAPAADRLAMVREGLAGLAGVDVLDVEIAGAGPSWTVDTLEALVRAHPGAQFWLVMGEDAWRGVNGWRRPERILELARPLVLARDGRAPDPASLPPGAAVLPDFAVPAASTEIRARLHRGEPVTGLLPPAVESYVREHRLYGGGKDPPCR